MIDPGKALERGIIPYLIPLNTVVKKVMAPALPRILQHAVVVPLGMKINVHPVLV